MLKKRENVPKISRSWTLYFKDLVVQTRFNGRTVRLTIIKTENSHKTYLLD